MEFWGVEVKAGETVKVVPEEGSIIHVSQAALGDSKGKGKGLIPLRVTIEDKKFILGSLSQENIPHITFDLVFHTEFELSHDCKDGSVFFLGYKGEVDEDDDEFPYNSVDSEDESLENEDELPALDDETLKKVLSAANGAAELKSDKKQKVAVNEPVKKDGEDSSDEEDEEDDGSDDEDMPALGEEDDSDDSEDEEDTSSEEEETPKEVKRGQKRGAGAAISPPSKKPKVQTQPSKPAAGKAAPAPAPAPALNKSKAQPQKAQANKGKKGGK